MQVLCATTIANNCFDGSLVWSISGTDLRWHYPAEVLVEIRKCVPASMPGQGDAELDVSRQLDKLLERQNQTARRLTKVLIVGAPDGGKSTLMK